MLIGIRYEPMASARLAGLAGVVQCMREDSGRAVSESNARIDVDYK